MFFILSPEFHLRRRLFVVIFLLALVFRLALAWKTGMFHDFKRTEMEGIALNVAEYGGYDLFGGPTAYSTPVFPLYLAALYSIFGTALLAQIVIVTLTCAVSALR